MTLESPETVGRRMDALDMWDAVLAHNWAVKPRGTAFPYFCTAVKCDGAPVRARFMMIEGWQSFHDYVRTRADVNFGFYSTPSEIPHFELVAAGAAGCAVFRHDPGYAPRPLAPFERGLCSRILWEAYGVMLRLETEPSLPMKYADLRSMFSRTENASGEWSDAPLAIPDPPPHVERVSLPKALVSKAKDLPVAQDEAVEADFRIMPNVVTKEPRPRCAYQLCAIVAGSGERVAFDRVSVGPEAGLRTLWEGMPQRFLLRLAEHGRIPGEVRVVSGRMFRMLRPLCMELPFRLLLRDSLPQLEAEFAAS